MSFRSNKGQIFCEPVNHFMQNCYPSCGEWRVHFSSHVCLCRKWIKSCCLAGWLSVWTSLTGLGLSISMFTVDLCRMTLVWTPVPVFLCSGGALFNYFRKCWSQSAHVVSFLVKGYNFLCSVCVVAAGLGWLGEKVEGGQPGLLEGLLVFLRDRGNSLHPWQTFVIDSL